MVSSTTTRDDNKLTRNRRRDNDDDGGDDESESSTLNFSNSITARLRWWSMVLAASVVAFCTMCDMLTSAERNHDRAAVIITVLILTFLTGVISAVFAIKVYITKEEDVSPSGNVWELVFAVLALVFWIANMSFGFLGNGRRATSGFGFLRSANMYYCLWIGFVGLVGVIVDFLRTFRDMDVLVTIHARGSRFGLWLVYLLGSIIMTGASINIFTSTGCRNIDEAMIPDNVDFTFDDVQTLCNRTALAVGLGTMLVAYCLMFVTELWYVKENPDQLFASESLFSGLTFVSLVISTGFITSNRGPAARIGNLYYSVWFCLLVSARLCLSCFREFQTRKKARRERNGTGLQL
jgi:hypothetical protein